uniref:DNA-directed RNA polymerase n=1 Tax=Chaetophoropsis pisiformis TaxID=1675661 RepID=A0A6M3U8A2_9CHLO|nr:beta subunit of RNA polymerase [Chaetophoropsis pisiformis]
MSISNAFNIVPIEYSLQTYHRSNQDTTLVHRPAVQEGDWVQAGDLIADSASSIGGEFSIGQNLLIAYLPWEGYNYEDAILISERLVYDDLYTSIHIERYDISTEKTPYGNEIITKDIMLLKETSELEHLDENGVAHLGSWLKEGDILVGKITPTEPKKEVARYIQLYNDILGKKMDYSFRDTSLRVPRGLEAKVIQVKMFPAKKNRLTKFPLLKQKSLKLKGVKGYKRRIEPIYLCTHDRELDIKEKLFYQRIFKKKKKIMPVGWENLLLKKSELALLGKSKIAGKTLVFPAISDFPRRASWENVSFPRTRTLFFESFLKQKFLAKRNSFFFMSRFFSFSKKQKSLIKTTEIGYPFLIFKKFKIHKKWEIRDFYNTSKFVVEVPWVKQKSRFLQVQRSLICCRSSHPRGSVRVPLQKSTNFPLPKFSLRKKNPLAGSVKLGSSKLRKDKKRSFFSLQLGPSDQLTNVSQSVTSVHVYLAEKRKVQVGDKMAGRHGNKGIISQILPRQDMPYLPDGSPIDLALNPLGVPSRMNVGQIYECLLGLAGKNLGEQYRIKPFDESFGSEASRSFVFSKLYEARLKTGQSWIFQPINPGKLKLFDGRTGNRYDQPITTGYSYMIKLVHLVDEKIHSRSSGPYSLITQQPLKGRSKHGGQRLGEMEVWAIEAYGAAFILLELLTIKSDDVTGRLTIWDYILYKKPLYIGTPASFKVLICELQALCLDIGIYKSDPSNNLKQINVSTMG